MTPQRVLIIDDHEESTRVLAQLIRTFWKLPDIPLEIIIVTTLQEGLEQAHEANVTILDLQLPDSEPWATAARIPEFRPPVIVITGHGDTKLSSECIKQGAAHVFIKCALMGFLPSFFSSLQQDVVRRSKERHAAQ